jgi:hypothetical protein
MFSSKTFLSLMTVALVVLSVSGCSKSTSAPTVVDLAPPAVPTDLHAVYTSGVVKVSWAPNVMDADFSGFTLKREVNGIEVELITTPTNVTRYIDTDPPNGLIRYYVSAVDLSGNESAYATVNVDLISTPPRMPHI